MGKGYSKRTQVITGILIHSTNNRNGNTAFSGEEEFLYTTPVVAAHYLVGSEQVTEFLNPREYIAFHAGATRNAKYSNEQSIGIEVHYSPSDKEQPINPTKIANLTVLVRQLLIEYSLTPDDISLHRWEAIPKNRKIDPSFWNDLEFELWRASLKEDERLMDTFTVLQPVFVYTEPELKNIARHINTEEIINGAIPVGYSFQGSYVADNTAIWISNGYGFIPAYAIESDAILNGIQVDPTILFRALNKYAPHLSQTDKDSIVAAYTTYGELTTIGNLYPFIQSAKETNWFTSERFVKSRNMAGLGATNDGAWGGHFSNISEGVLAQYAHLLCYAVPDEQLNFIQKQIARISPRRLNLIAAFGLGSAGNRWVGLNGMWAYPGKDYGESILGRADVILKL